MPYAGSGWTHRDLLLQIFVIMIIFVDMFHYYLHLIV